MQSVSNHEIIMAFMAASVAVWSDGWHKLSSVSQQSSISVNGALDRVKASILLNLVLAGLLLVGEERGEDSP